MKVSNDISTGTSNLRHRAARLMENKPLAIKQCSNCDMQENLREARANQLRLEMQQKELITAHVEICSGSKCYAEFYDFAPVGYFTLNQVGNIHELNLTGASQLGIERSELVGQRFDAFVIVESQPLFNSFFEKLFKGHAKETCEIRLNTHNNSYIDVLMKGITTVDRQVCHLALMDITARKHAEESLRWANESNRLMFESVTDCSIIQLDTGGRVMSWNVGAQRIKGYTTEEIIGQNFSRFYTDEDKKSGKPQQELAQAVADGSSISEGWRKRKDGSIFWARETCNSILDQSGNLQGFAKLTRDLTAHQQYHVKLVRAKNVAEKANLAKTDFLSSMSHELRTPLNAILGFAQLIEAGTPPLTPTQQLRLSEILRAGWYLLELINEILDLATIESGKISLSQTSMSLIEVMSECQAIIYPQAQKRDIRMSFSSLDTSLFVRADRTRLKQVLINLLSNAIKYNRDGGMVEVSFSASTSERIRINVKDTGAGLPPEKLTQLFQPFNRLGQEASTVEGTGIGLAVSKRLVELMGGAIGVESTVGVGSVFWLELTVADELLPATDRGKPAAPAAKVYDQTQQRTLMYIEDNPANLLLVEHIIAGRSDIRLLSAMNGKVGIELAGAHLSDVILMDINLTGGISGVDALRVLRGDPFTAHIPIIALSANVMPHDIANALKAGFFRYLTKPIKLAEFMSAIDEALEFAGVRCHAGI